MTCPACKAANANDARFCAVCGAALLVPAAAPLYQPPYVGKVQRNLQALGILWCIYAVYHAMAGILGLFFVNSFFGRHSFFNINGNSFYFPEFHGLVVLAMPMLILMLVLNLLCGYALLTRQPWGRVFAIVLGIIAMHTLFGIALGIYTLVVLVSSASAAEYDALSAQP